MVAPVTAAEPEMEFIRIFASPLLSARPPSCGDAASPLGFTG
jgi:hypothetical protein